MNYVIAVRYKIRGENGTPSVAGPEPELLIGPAPEQMKVNGPVPYPNQN